MKLAEALQERADTNRAIEQLQARFYHNVLVQEGEQTAEDPQNLKEKLDAALERLMYLIACINLTNSKTCIDGETLTEKIARKDMLQIKLGAYKNVASAASQTVDRARNSEIKIKPAISVAEWQKEIDAMSKELRLLDNQLQAANWSTDLIEM